MPGNSAGLHKETTMHKHTYTYTPAPKPSKAIEALIVVAALLVFASWGAMLAFYG